MRTETGTATTSHDHGHPHDDQQLDRNRHDDHIRSFVIVTDQPVPAGALEMFLELLRASHGSKLLRLKGIVKLAETPGTPVVVHGVQHLFHPTARLERWPDDDHRTRLVFITRDLPERTVRELFDAFMGRVAPDRPDRAALTDNPLVPSAGASPALPAKAASALMHEALQRSRRQFKALADGETSWTGSGCGIIRRASPPISIRHATPRWWRCSRRASPYATREACVCMGKALTYAELDKASRAFAAFLQARGIGRGARVALMMPNVLQYPVAIAGTFRAGCTVVNTNPLYKPRELEFQLTDAGAEAIVVLENFASVLQEALPRTPVKLVVVASLGDMLGRSRARSSTASSAT